MQTHSITNHQHNFFVILSRLDVDFDWIDMQWRSCNSSNNFVQEKVSEIYKGYFLNGNTRFIFLKEKK